jgi:hypothetical protein
MDREDALLIKEWRTRGCTWRKVADLAAEKWPDRGYIAGNQLEGRELCFVAAQTLEEEHYSDPWN